MERAGWDHCVTNISPVERCAITRRDLSHKMVHITEFGYTTGQPDHTALQHAIVGLYVLPFNSAYSFTNALSRHLLTFALPENCCYQRSLSYQSTLVLCHRTLALPAHFGITRTHSRSGIRSLRCYQRTLVLPEKHLA